MNVYIQLTLLHLEPHLRALHCFHIKSLILSLYRSHKISIHGKLHVGIITILQDSKLHLFWIHSFKNVIERKLHNTKIQII